LAGLSLRRIKERRRSPNPLRDPGGASHGVRRTAERCMPAGSRWIGSRDAASKSVSVLDDGCSDRPSPDPFGSGSFSRALRPLRSSFSGSPGHPGRSVTRVPSLAGDRSCQDFVPHRDIAGCVHDPLARHAGVPGPASFRPRVFSTPRRLSPPPVSRACFIPPPRPGFCSVQGILPIRSGPSAHRRGLPPCRSDSRAHRQAGCHARARRLRGIAPRIDAFRESGGLDLKRGRSPRRIQLLSQAPAPPP